MSFIEGDIDRPVVSQQLYNGQDLPPWSAGTDSSANHAGVLSGWHSRALDGSGYNQWIADDAPGQVRTRLASSHAASQLNLGHLKAQSPDESNCGAWRGSGAELRSDAWVVTRAGEGLLISTLAQERAAGTLKQLALDMLVKAVKELEQKLREMQAYVHSGGETTNRPLKPGEQIYRFFGPEGVTHRYKLDESHPGGGWWGLGSPPKTAKEWREKAAVLDEWNRDGYLVVGTVPADSNIKAAVGTISEQSGKNIPGQYLPGGNPQAVIDMDIAAKGGLANVAKEVIASGKAKPWKDPVTGMTFEIKPTGWTDANGIHGYINMPGAASVQTARLGSREMATKENREVTK